MTTIRFYKNRLSYNRKYEYHVISYFDVDIQSMAASLLLRNQYVMQDTSHCNSSGKMSKASFSRLKIQVFEECRLLHDGKLICSYCKRNDLNTDYKKRNKEKLATIDHIIPISAGGEFLNKNNMCIACFPCNNKKGNSIYN